jgi:hypothetical protein
MEDDVTDETKARRLQEIVTYNKTCLGKIRGIHWSNRRSFSRKVSKNRQSFQEEIHKALFFPKRIIKLVIL